MLELLSPAGSMEALRAAVQNGANAVYLGLAGAGNARRGARNFSPDELREAVKYCHIRGVNVHLALNTLFSDREMAQAAELIRTAAACDVDAFIVQDLGVLQLCRQMAPHIACHGSTQMSVHNLEGVRQAAKLGVSRVVLARELPLAEITHICRNSPIEIEVFVHGALCMCYSGQCYFSSAIGSRSGNRGMCAQPCRLPYGYGHLENKYPLSLKDNCLLPHLKQLKKAGVAALKIEGRMRRPEYVATATRIYRAALDGKTPSQQDLTDLRNAFSRQGFTQGYFTGQTGPAMFGTRKEDRADSAMLVRARSTYENVEAPLVPVRFYAIMTRKQGSMLAVQDNDGHICKTTGPQPMDAIQKPLTEDILAARLAKTGGTPYACRDVKCVVEPGLTLPVSAINAMRREVLSHLTAVRGRREQVRLGRFTKPVIYSGASGEPKLTVAIHSAKQLTDSLISAAPAVLYAPLSEILENPNPFTRLSGRTELTACLPRVIWDGEAAALRRQLDRAHAMGLRRVLVGNLGHVPLAHARGFEVAGDFGLNIYNSRAMNCLLQTELISATASFEMTLPQLRDLSKAVPTELIVYGRLPLMLTENCIIKNRTGDCTCQTGQTKLVDRMGAEFPVIRDPGTCRSVVLNGKKLYLLDKKDELNRLGLWALRLQFTTESPAEVNRILAAWRSGAAFEPGTCTRGLYLRGVE